VVPGLFGLGTGLPVVALAVVLGLGVRRAGEVFRALSSFDRWARVSSGVVFLAVGLYFVSTRILGWGI
jgi:cytochrome c biogenesis protein CcdA